ncbi:HlyD family secretion protein [Actinomadura rubteroloni]|uniref:HlyD family secretion protein n=1 Tax=Actinomadura rubteroloni TaxID=1926885 RepID=A0A2P4UIT2_9ACTN|nr:efflux RND transporter periplasmic adaptor subunit [Actinomadura rubteroloni]POM24957.1 HlyD family secretion protein [Actinomadura rubteroloni]
MSDAPPTGSGAPPPGRAQRRRRGRGPYVASAVALALAAGGTAVVLATRDGGNAPATANTSPVTTAPITRGDVIDTESVDGNLTYTGSRDISAPGQGTVTWAASEGSVVTRGHVLLRVDNKPLILLYGSMPSYRTLRDGVADGKDVYQLESNLRALGYGSGITVDKKFTAATAAAVKEWQDDLGLTETGAVEAGQIVFQPGAVRVGDVQAEKGERVSPGMKAMTITGTRPIVHIPLATSKQSLAKKGARVTVEMPSGKRVRGRISSVGKVAKAGTEKDDTATIDVYVTLSGEATGGLDQAPVSVELESDRAAGVLSVPVEALLGLREGGFGVEVVDGAAKRIVPVETGTYGGGRVEISGEGLREGMKVEVPRS